MLFEKRAVKHSKRIMSTSYSLKHLQTHEQIFPKIKYTRITSF